MASYSSGEWAGTGSGWSRLPVCATNWAHPAAVGLLLLTTVDHWQATAAKVERTASGARRVPRWTRA
ncbi:hypothetical protein ACMA1D_12030 [Streptomyces sp. 796.1]|uniref:hypothetical protein n=1 Tax=Streptomyces sp. 796.1 TaxID=3163029 RepID=UPI0039C9B3A5